MVLTLDGNSGHDVITHAWRKVGLFGGKNPICYCSWSNQMPYTNFKKHGLLPMCAPISELPSMISTIGCIGFAKFTELGSDHSNEMLSLSINYSGMALV